ncbi:PREDICTED: putative uncharacterized protein DDB_G0275317 [Erythranthe guttata]|uniref:putative uncharacterized protein DDB_G0275317 n=1 Tax=Erythranthe guttata TaxID=4155 RepID=UPI00064DD9AE|nr:PREDICTED: putative uncharacterized protein DDB_G0275317 [Erythranthe guttata]|eukprot:XP_012854960.1 PREDICTED: putative uncharacterized protein DDB_G0275317 [Erythranthe guttata]
MNTTDEQSSVDSGLKAGGWSLKARISRENTNSRRFSSSSLKNSNIIAISSTASSPGYTFRDEIDPSTYSFTTALKALQAKTVYTWEYLSPDGGLTLNSKWNEAEKYICNPLSGEVPLECLSAKTLSGRSVINNNNIITTSRITMSAPLIYPPPHLFHPKSPITSKHHHENEVKFTIQEEKRRATRDVGIQSTPPPPAEKMSSGGGSPSPAPATPSIEERSMKRNTESTETEEDSSSPASSEKQKSSLQAESNIELCVLISDMGERGERERNEERGERKKRGMIIICCMWSRRRRLGCLSSFKGLWQKKSKQNDDDHNDNNNNNNNNNNNPSSPTFLRHFNACYKQ